MNINILLNNVNNYVWGWGLISLLIFTGIFYTVKLKFIQFKLFSFLISKCKEKDCISQKNSGISQLKIVTSSLGTAMGTGNIIGVSSALAIGGVGAIFWMWVSAFFGMALIYSENYLSITYRKKVDGHWLSGPMAYLKYGLNAPFLACLFSVFCIFASFGMGGMVQSNSIGNAVSNCFGIDRIIIAILIFIAVFSVISGGIKRIGSASQIIIPILTGIYILVSLIILFKFREQLLPSFKSIFASAFSFKSTVGGLTGGAISQAFSIGIRRGVFSNEAGLGSSPIMHGSANEKSPSVQGMWSIFEVFLDTIVCCTLTALVLITTSNGTDFQLNRAFSSVLGNNAEIFLTISIMLFAFCTITGWFFCGESAFRFLTKNKFLSQFRFVFALFTALGAIFSLETVWTLSDIFNGLMAFPNLVALILLCKVVKK